MSRNRDFIPEQYRCTLPPYPEGYTPEVIAIYARISYDKKGQEEGVMRQVGMAEGVVRRRFPDARIVHRIDNDRGASALSKDDRPEYDRLIAEVNAGEVQGICVTRIDRWTRRPQEIIYSIDWVRRLGLVWFDKDLQFDMTTPAGRANVQREVIRAEEEAATIGRRTADAAYWRRMTGDVATSHAAFGYAMDGAACTYRSPHPIEAPIVKALFDKASRGVAPAGLLAWLRSEEVTSRYVKRARWTSMYVTKILRNPIYAGLVPFQGKVFRDLDGLPVEANVVPLVDRAVWDLVQKRIDGRPKVNAHGGSMLRHALAGKVICDLCGSKMQAQVFTRNVKRPKPDPTQGFEVVPTRVGRWYCLSRTGGCGRMARNYDHVNLVVQRAVRAGLDAHGVGGPIEVDLDEGDDWSQVISENERKITNLDAGVAAGFLDEDDASRLRADYRATIRKAEHERVNAVRQSEVVTTESRDEAVRLLESDDPADLWDRRALLDRYIDHVRILPARKGCKPDWSAIRVVPVKG